MTEAAALVCLVLGTFFFAAGTVGILRMPDVYTRMHVAAKSDTLGAGLWLLGLAIASGGGVTALKLILLLAFLWLTSPTAAHCMARAAHRTGVPMVCGTASLDDGRSIESPRETSPVEGGVPGEEAAHRADGL